MRFPLFFRRHEFRPGSGGRGRYRGGPGGVLELRVESDGPALANTAGDGVRHGACGMAGGEDGAPHHYRLLSKGKSREVKTKEVGIEVKPGDTFMVESGGGGGWGDPKKRTSQEHAADEQNGFVTPNGRSRRPKRKA